MATPSQTSYSDAIHAILAASGLSHTDVARYLGSSHFSVVRWERGDAQVPAHLRDKVLELLSRVEKGESFIEESEAKNAFASHGARGHKELPLFDEAPPVIHLSEPELSPILSRLRPEGLPIGGHQLLAEVLVDHESAAPTIDKPAAEGISAGKNTYTYDAHTYHTKVPPQGIAEVIKQYLPEHGLVLDPFHAAAPRSKPDMRIGWLIWEDLLTEFLYFEEPMRAPNAKDYYAVWNETKARGVRKSSTSLWIYEKSTKQKRYSVTTSAGIKIQPYFDVPPPNDSHLYYFRVQSEPVDADTVLLWVAASTAKELKQRIGSLEKEVVSRTILRIATGERRAAVPANPDEDLAVPIPISAVAYKALLAAWEAVSDEHRMQLLVKALMTG